MMHGETGPIQFRENPRVEHGITRLWVPHEGGEIAFSERTFGPQTYDNVVSEIRQRGFVPPNGEQMASLIHAVYSQNGATAYPEFNRIFENLLNNQVWIFNGNILTDHGIYVFDRSVASANEYNINSLEAMLKYHGKDFKGVKFAMNGQLRFAPTESYEPNLEFYDREEFENDGFMIATFGKYAGKVYEALRAQDFRPVSAVKALYKGQEPQVGFTSIGRKDNKYVISGGEDGLNGRIGFGLIPDYR